MGISPAEGEAEVINDIRRTYAQAEMSLIKKIAKQVQGGKPDIPNWQNRKLAKLDKLTKEVREEVIGETLQDGKEEAVEAVERAYKKGIKDVDSSLIKAYGAKELTTTGDLTAVDQEAVKALSRGIQDRLNSVDVRVMRTTEDVYRKVIGEASRPGITGAISRKEAAQKALNEFANRGVVGFVDSAGRNWSLSSYTEMATRSTMGRSSLNGSMNRMKQNDHDLAIVGTSYEPCPLCMPWEGKILSVSGESEKYPSVEEADSAGLWHPNCYSDDTEVYTNEGWKLFGNLKGEEQIFSLNPDTHIPEWSDYKHLIVDVPDKMIHFKSNSFDLLVTPEHQMYAGFNSSKNGEKTVNWELRSAEKCTERNFRQIRTVNWKGEKQGSKFGINEKTFAKLLGYYISEGYTERNKGHHNRVIISQHQEEKAKQMYSDLKSIGFRRSGERIYKTDKELTDYFEKFGHSYEKYLPDWIMKNKSKIIEIFLDAFRLGDGSERTTTHKTKNFESIEKTYFTSSNRLADQLGELILKAGYYPSFSLRKDKGKKVEHHNGVYEGNYDLWIIRQNNTEFSHHNVSPSISHYGIQSEWVDYDGVAYDVELEKNHILLIRRNGKIAWSGNCTHSISPYIEGLTEKPDMDKEKKAERYKNRKQQRYNERQIRKWKRRKSAAITEEDQQFAQSKITEWRREQKKFIEETGRYRKYGREQIDQAR